MAVQSSPYLFQHLLEETQIPSPLLLSSNAPPKASLWAQESVSGLLPSLKQGEVVPQP